MKSLRSGSAPTGALTWSKSTVGVSSGKLGHPAIEFRTLADRFGQHRPLQHRRTLAIAQSDMDSADMGRKRWAHVSKSDRSLIMSELARRPRGRPKLPPEPETPKLTWGNQTAAGIVSAFDAASCERNLTQ